MINFKIFKNNKAKASLIISFLFVSLNFFYFNAVNSNPTFNIDEVAPKLGLSIGQFEYVMKPLIRDLAAQNGTLIDGEMTPVNRVLNYNRALESNPQARQSFETLRQELKNSLPSIGFELTNFEELDLNSTDPNKQHHVFKIKPKFDASGKPLNLVSAHHDQVLKATGTDTVYMYPESYKANALGFVSNLDATIQMSLAQVFVMNPDFNNPSSSSTLYHEAMAHSLNNIALANGLNCSGCINVTGPPNVNSGTYQEQQRTDEVTGLRRNLLDSFEVALNESQETLLEDRRASTLKQDILRVGDTSLTNIKVAKAIQDLVTEPDLTSGQNKSTPGVPLYTLSKKEYFGKDRATLILNLHNPYFGKDKNMSITSKITVPLKQSTSDEYFAFRKNSPNGALPADLDARIRAEFLELAVNLEAEARHAHSQAIEILDLTKTHNIPKITDADRSQLKDLLTKDAQNKSIRVNADGKLTSATQDQDVKVFSTAENQSNRNAVDSLTNAFDEHYPVLDKSSTPTKPVVSSIERAPRTIEEALDKHPLTLNAFRHIQGPTGGLASQNGPGTNLTTPPSHPGNTTSEGASSESPSATNEQLSSTTQENKIETVSHSTIKNYSARNRAAIVSGAAGGIMLSAADGLQIFGSEVNAYSAATTPAAKQAVVDRLTVKVSQTLSSEVAFVTLVAAGAAGTFIVVGSVAGLAAGTTAATAVGVGVTAFYVGKSIEAIMFNTDGARDDLVAALRDCANTGCENLRNMAIDVAEVFIESGSNAIDNPQTILDGMVKAALVFDKLLARILNGENVEVAVGKFAEEMTPTGSTAGGSSNGSTSGGGGTTGSSGGAAGGGTSDSTGGTVSGGRGIASDPTVFNPEIRDSTGNVLSNPQLPVAAENFLQNNFVPVANYEGINFLSNPVSNVNTKVPEIINLWTNDRTPLPLSNLSPITTPPVVLSTLPPTQTPTQAEIVPIKTSLSSTITTSTSNHVYLTTSGEKVQLSDDVAKDRFSVWWPFSYTADSLNQQGNPSKVKWSDGKEYSIANNYGIVKKEGTLITREDGQSFLLVASLSPKKGSYLRADFISNKVSVSKDAVLGHKLPSDQIKNNNNANADIDTPNVLIPENDTTTDVTGAVPIETQTPRRGIALDLNYPVNSRNLIRIAAQGN